MELLAVFLPLFAFVLTGLLGKTFGDRAVQFITCTCIIVSAICSMALFSSVILYAQPYTLTLAQWMSVGDFSVTWALRLDLYPL